MSNQPIPQPGPQEVVAQGTGAPQTQLGGPAGGTSSSSSSSSSVDTRSLLSVYLVAGAMVVLWKDSWRAFAFRYWWASLAIIALALIFLFLPQTREWLESTSDRTALLVFGVVPVLVIIGIVIGRFPEYQFFALRVPYLVLVILLPGVMFHLFIVSRKTSLLNEFVANLDRLGVLEVEGPGTQSLYSNTQSIAVLSGRRRLMSYIRKFEAIYGSVPPEMLQQALRGTGAESRAATIDTSSPSTPDGRTTETIIPVVIATFLIALGWLVTLPLVRPTETGGAWIAALTLNDPMPVHFAFLGAYFFSLQMLFRRYVLRDLRPSAYVAISIRIILAVTGTWVVTATADSLAWHLNGKPSLLMVGFVIGVFPPIVWQFVQSAFKKITGAGFFLPSLRSELPISDLDGLTVWHEARLEEEGIENVPNMATADIVELMVQTRLPSEQIIDWIDQAILLTTLGPDGPKDPNSPRRKLRVHGIRTACSLQVTYERSITGPDRDAFEKILDGGGPGARSPIRAMVETVTTNPNLGLVRTWKGLADRRAM